VSSLRANALPETAFVMALALIVVFGCIQVALAGFDQLNADGAAFMGAHSAVAQDPSSPSGPYANQVGQSVFPHTASNAQTISNPTTDTTESVFRQTFSTMAFSRFLDSGFLTTSRIIEPSVPSPGPLNGMQLPYSSTACIESKINTVSGTTGKSPIGLPAISSLTTTSSSGAIDLSSSELTSEIGSRVTLFDNLAAEESTAFQTDIPNVGTAVSALLSLPVLSLLKPTLQTLLQTTLDSDLSTALDQAFAGGGTAVTGLSSTISALETTLNVTLGLLDTGAVATDVANLDSALSKVVTDITTLSGYESQVNALDSAVSGQTCP
jgi:hypothetical protein